MKGQLDLFSVESYEYFFLIQPDKITDREVRLYKRIVNSSIYLSYENLWSVAHLSLFKWRVNYSVDAFIIEKLTKALEGIGGFMIKLDGLEIFHHRSEKRSLVLKVKNPESIQIVSKILEKEFKFRERSSSPHITIVRSIPVKEFDKLGNSLNQFDYKGEFLCNKITILKKQVGQDKHYVVLHEAMLN